MVRTIKDFIERWQEEADNTMLLIHHLDNESLNKAVPGTRTLGRLANHIVEVLTEFPHKLGLPIEEEYITYNTVEELAAAYRRNADRVAAAVSENWDDRTLEGQTKMYGGEVWKNGVSLYYLMAHQTHHRAQMTTIMRASGLRVPGIYGPSQEEWRAMNMQPLA